MSKKLKLIHIWALMAIIIITTDFPYTENLMHWTRD